MEDFIIEDGVLKEYVGEESDVVIPDGVTAIGDCAFDGCDMETVFIPDSGYKHRRICVCLTSPEHF